MKSHKATVTEKLENIQDLALVHDHEAAHDREDALFEYVLRLIAKSPPLVRRSSGEASDVVELAKLALTSKRISFQRYTA